jgi:hypothetical protein
MIQFSRTSLADAMLHLIYLKKSFATYKIIGGNYVFRAFCSKEDRDKSISNTQDVLVLIDIKY